MPSSISDTIKHATPSSRPITIIYETKPSKDKAKTEIIPLFEERKTEVVVKRLDAGDNKSNTKPNTQNANAKEPKLSTDTIGSCKCVQMTIKTHDTLDWQQYVSYSFVFTNTCKQIVWIHTPSLTFAPFKQDGKKVDVIRKATFVKRPGLPDFIKLNKGETYQFKFADDPFFEFDLKKGEQYRFSFAHTNTTQKCKNALGSTYQCFRQEDKMIYVK